MAFSSKADEAEARATLLFALAIGRHFMVGDDAGSRAALARAGEHLLRP
ncbi:hypothetical protein [Agromyces bauzanensis]